MFLLDRIGYRGQHPLALKADGTVWAWGDNLYGQLGNGSNTDSSVPVQVAGLAGVVGIAAGVGGGQHAGALKADGTVRVLERFPSRVKPAEA